MKKSSLIISVFVALVVAMPGCENKLGCTDPIALNYDAEVDEEDGTCVYESENLMLKFHHLAGTLPMAYNQEFTLSTGRKIKFTKAQMYLSGFKATGSSVDETYNTHLLITGEDDASYPIGKLITANSVTGLRLAVGVDSSYNHLDPASFVAADPLSANQEYFGHWGWNPGYKFIVMEGMIDSTTAMNGTVTYPFIYHLGFEEVYKLFSITTDFTSDGTDELVELDVDWLAFFNDLNLPEENSSHMTSAAQKLTGHKIIDSAPDAITLKQ
jgi:hypothetical protein